MLGGKLGGFRKRLASEVLGRSVERVGVVECLVNLYG